MRTLWLASAASLFIAGAACAQTSQTGPAPTGAPNAATMTNPGQSPGSTAPATSGSAMSGDSNTAPAKNASGAPNGPMVTSPSASPGKTQSSATGMNSSMSTSGMSDKSAFENKPMAHHYGRGMGMGSVGMPKDGTATTYLTIAKHSVMHHNKMMADDALSHAETRMLDRAVPQGEITADSDPAVSSIESARKAVMAGDMKTANMDIDMAMQQSGGGGMSSNSGMSGGAMSPAMSSPASMQKPMPHSIYGSSNSGMAPAPGDTSDSGVAGSPATATSPTKPASSP